MRQLLNDNRALPRTMDEADVVFVRLASLTAKRNRIIAKLEEAVKALQARVEPELAALKKEISEAEEQLSGFVLANQRLFARPRQHKTAFGQYGLRTATKLLVRDRNGNFPPIEATCEVLEKIPPYPVLGGSMSTGEFTGN